MQTHKVEIEIPTAIARYFQMDDEKIKLRISILLFADIVRQGLISFGKAAELADIDKVTFITEMGNMGIPYFDGDISEVLNDAETVGQTMNSASL